MPTWERLRLLAESADNATFAKSRTWGSVQTFNSQDEVMRQTVEAATGGVTVELGFFTTINAMIIENLSTTAGQTVDAEWFVARGSQVDTVTFARAAAGDTITDDSAAGTMVTNGARAGSWVRIINAATAANNDTWLIRSTTTNVVTLALGNTVTADGADALTLFFQDRCTQELGIAATAEQSILVIGGTVVAENDLLLTSAAGAPACRITVFGT